MSETTTQFEAVIATGADGRQMLLYCTGGKDEYECLEYAANCVSVPGWPETPGLYLARVAWCEDGDEEHRVLEAVPLQPILEAFHSGSWLNIRRRDHESGRWLAVLALWEAGRGE